jgi:hypothetical protein
MLSNKKICFTLALALTGSWQFSSKQPNCGNVIQKPAITQADGTHPPPPPPPLPWALEAGTEAVLQTDGTHPPPPPPPLPWAHEAGTEVVLQADGTHPPPPPPPLTHGQQSFSERSDLV